MRGPSSIHCNCNHHNDPWRLFCGGCGAKLAPACVTCGFVNPGVDRYCGGCGKTLAPATTKLPVARPPTRVKHDQTVPIDRIEDVLLSETTITE